MFFKSKYIFETKSTRFKRVLLNSGLVFCFLSSLVILSGFYLIHVSDTQREVSVESLFQRPPELIVVFTGQKGRIPYAVAQGKKYNQSHIFITGVHTKNNVATLMQNLSLSQKIDPDLLEIDYLARNTVENVISTIRYLRSNPSITRVLIISHDYHILRIKTIFEQLRNPKDPFEVYYDGLKENYKDSSNIKILYIEIFKFFRTWLFLKLWDV